MAHAIPRLRAVVAVALLAVASGQDTFGETLETTEEWKCVSFSGTATEGMCAGTSFSGGTMCCPEIYDSSDQEISLSSALITSVNAMTEQSCRDGIDFSCAFVKGVPKESTYATCESATFCSGLKFGYELKQCSTDADCPYVGADPVNADPGNQECCSSLLEPFKEICADIKVTEEEMASVSTCARTNVRKTFCCVIPGAVKCWCCVKASLDGFPCMAQGNTYFTCTTDPTCVEVTDPSSTDNDGSSSSAKSIITFTFEAAYSKDAFLAQGLKETFVSIFAEIAGVDVDSVVIKELNETTLRYHHRDELSTPKRRLLSASLKAEVEITVPTSRVNDAVSKLTEENINRALEKDGLPKLIAVSEAQVQDIPPKGQAGSSSTLQHHGLLLGFTLLFFTVFQVHG